MVKNHAAKAAARKLKAESGITYPRALDLVRTAVRTAGYPALTIGLSGGAPLMWQPGAGSRLEIAGMSGTGKSELMAFMASQATAAGVEVHILDMDKRGPDYTKVSGAHVATTDDEVREVLRELKSSIRPAIVFLEGIPRLASDMDELRAEMTVGAGELADAGYPVVASWQFPKPRWDDSDRIFLGHSLPRQRAAFFGSAVNGAAGFLEGHYRPSGEDPVLFELCPDSVFPAPLAALPDTPRFDDLGLPQAARAFATVEPGLFVFAGPTGAGKSSSLASVVNIVTERFARRVIVAEEVRELSIRHGRSDVRHRVVPRDGSMAQLIDDAVGEVPDVLVIGEVRDGASVVAAVRAAQAGHTVFMTMHAESAADVPGRLIGMVDAEGWPNMRDGVAQVLKGVAFQKLLEASAGNHARVPAVELLTMNRAAYRMIRDFDDSGLAAMVADMKEGCISLAVSLSQLVLDGVVGERTAEMAMKTPMAFRRALHAGRRHSAPSLHLGATETGDHVRHSVGMYPHLLVVSDDQVLRAAGLDHVAAGFPGLVTRVDPADAQPAFTELTDWIAEVKDLARRDGEGHFTSLPREIRPERRCALVDVPKGALTTGEDSAQWRVSLAKLGREASTAGVTLLLGVESEAELESMGVEFHTGFARLMLGAGGASYCPFPRGNQERFTPAWTAEAEAA